MIKDFGELTGTLYDGIASKIEKGGKVEVSAIRRGCASSPARRTTTLKYVAAGAEIYRYSGRVHRVHAGTFLVLPEGHQGEVTVDARGDTALGMCVFLPRSDTAPPPQARLDEPLLFPAHCSALGMLLSNAHRKAVLHRRDAPALAKEMLATVSSHLEPFLIDAARVLDGIAAEKASTRYETLRRLNIARAYLHEVIDRPVALAELASHAGVSRFQLARNFGDCFGATPAAYHRRVRLDLARHQLDRGTLNCTEAALRFGFGGVPHFSRAYLSAFGKRPSAKP